MNIFSRWMIFHPIKNIGNFIIMTFLLAVVFVVYWIGFSPYINPAQCLISIFNETYFTYPSHPHWFMRMQKPFWMMAVMAYVGFEVLSFVFDCFCWAIGTMKRFFVRHGAKLAYAFLIAMAVGFYLDNLK